MRHFFADWQQWSFAERIGAVALAIGSVMVTALAAV